MARAIIRLMPTRLDILRGEFVIADSGSLISRETSKVDRPIRSSLAPLRSPCLGAGRARTGHRAERTSHDSTRCGLVGSLHFHPVLPAPLDLQVGADRSHGLFRLGA